MSGKEEGGIPKLWHFYKKSWWCQVFSAWKVWTFTPREAAIDIFSTIRTWVVSLIILGAQSIKVFLAKLFTVVIAGYEFFFV
jgi:hypothetical protein